MKIKFKEIAEKISLKKVRKNISGITGKYANSLNKGAFQKYINGCKGIKDYIATSLLVPEMEKQKEKTIQLEKIDEKSKQLTKVINDIGQDDEYRIGIKNCYLKQAEIELQKLKNKRDKVSNVGLGVFALSKLTLLNIGKNVNKMWTNFLKQVQEDKQQLTIKHGEKLMEKNLKRQYEIQEETKEILNQYPELQAYYNNLYNNISSEKSVRTR